MLNPRSKGIDAPFAVLEREVLCLFPRQTPPASGVERSNGAPGFGQRDPS